MSNFENNIVGESEERIKIVDFQFMHAKRSLIKLKQFKLRAPFSFLKGQLGWFHSPTHKSIRGNLLLLAESILIRGTKTTKSYQATNLL